MARVLQLAIKSTWMLQTRSLQQTIKTFTCVDVASQTPEKLQVEKQKQKTTDSGKHTAYRHSHLLVKAELV